MSSNYNRGGGRGQRGQGGRGGQEGRGGQGGRGGQRGGGAQGGQGATGGQRGGGQQHTGPYRQSPAHQGSGDRPSGQYQRGTGYQSRGQGGRGGGDYSRGGRGRGFPDVRQLAKALPSATAIAPIARQRSHGTEGEPIELIVNHFPISIKNVVYFRYDVEIRLVRNDGKGFIPIVGPQERKMRNDLKADNIRVVQKMATEWPQVFANKFFVFDGQKNLYCAQALGIGSGATPKATKDVTILLDGFREQTFQVKIQFVAEVRMDFFDKFFKGDPKTLKTRKPSEFSSLLQALEITLRYMPAQSRVPVGRNLYSIGNRRPAGDNALIGFGHYAGVQLTESGLTYNMDRTATLFRSAGTLREFIEGELGVQNLASVNFDDQTIGRVNRKIKGLKIFTTHILNQKRRYFVEMMSTFKPNECQFSVKGTDGTEAMTDVETYFRSEYKLHLGLRNVPCIQLKGGVHKRYLPVDVCHVYEHQPVPRRLITPNMTRNIVKEAQQWPDQRFGLNQESAQEVVDESRDLIQSFGIEVDLSPIKLTGRVLKPPTVKGNEKRVNIGKRLNRWLFYNLSHDVHKDLKALFNRFFKDGLIRTGNQMGIQIYPIEMTDRIPVEVSSSPYKGRETIESAFKRAKDLKNVEMIFFCIPRVDEMYYYIKYFADIVYGIPSQCLFDKNFIETPNGYFNNILLKINAKLDGQNQILDSTQRPDIFTGAKNQTMIIGVDVTHPGTNPLANERVISSIAASVASYDSEFTKFMATVSAQPMNTEIIANFDVMFGQHLQHFYAKNQKWPKSVILFRDGVSEGQFSQVVDEEIPLIGKAFKKVKANAPKTTVFVVQKRHHTRFMPFLKEVDFRGREVRNIPAGTVVDHTIVNPLYNEYHLCSHRGLLGTSRHAKYVCLRDDHNWTEDQKQKLSFYLCHTYCRCTKSISIPIPVMYAHLAAFRAKQHIAAQNIEFEAGGRTETPEQKLQREHKLIVSLNNKIRVNPNLISLPYYS